MSTEYVYVVTNFGCNSGAHDMWIPETRVFTNKDDAYTYYNRIAPCLNDDDNRAEHITLKDGEAIRQLPGYLNGYGNYAKRPEGVVIRYIKIE